MCAFRFLLIIVLVNHCCFNLCIAAFSEDRSFLDHYDVITDLLPHIDSSHASLVKLREKRDLQTDLKDQYQAINPNATTTNVTPNPVGSNASNDSTERKNASAVTSFVVPYNNNNDRPLLGVNGTGQRKDMSDKQTKFPKKTLSTIQSENKKDIDELQEIIDTIDVPENGTLEAIQKNNMTVNQTTDHHQYYNSSIYVDKEKAQKIWDVVKNFTHNSMLSQSHRRAMTVDLSFDFPFYGHPVRKITVATGGFLYTGEYVHSWLAATQYIAPLMANFDTSISEDSYVRFHDNGTAFSVIWENVALQDKQDVGNFTFSATLHKNGDIVFAYFSVPILVNAIQDDKHPVKVGLSDAYIIDKVVYFARRKTIYEYHRVNFASSEITNSTIIYLTALPTCLDYSDCVSCMNHNTSFKCVWCPILNRCSTGTDRRTQDWLQKGCDRTQISESSLCPALGEKGNNAKVEEAKKSDRPQNAGNPSSLVPSTQSPRINTDSTSSSTTESTHPIVDSSNKYSDSANKVDADILNRNTKSALDQHEDPKSMGLAVGFLVPICLVMAITMWVVYAYRNPHTKSGQLLIQYRPSQWSWRRGEARYTAATIHM